MNPLSTPALRMATTKGAARVAPGTPTGGQFAAVQRAESDVDLGDGDSVSLTKSAPPNTTDYAALYAALLPPEPKRRRFWPRDRH